MNACRMLSMAGLMCCLGATGWADNGGRRGRDFGRPDHRPHQIAPGGWPQRHWQDDRHRHWHEHERRGGSFWFIQPSRPIEPYGTYGGVRPSPFPTYPTYQPPVVIVQPPVFYWYCANPAGYYPYVQQCYTFWQQVPAVR